MKNPIELMLEEHREHLNPYHLFSVSNLDVDEKHRKKTLLPGHMAEGFIFNKNYLVEYIGTNAKSTPALRAEKEKAALESAQNDLEEAQRMSRQSVAYKEKTETEEGPPEKSDVTVSQYKAINSVPSKEAYGPKFQNPRR